MSSKVKAGLLLYRQRSEGLEVYLVPGDDNSLQMPESFSLEHHEALETFCDNLEKTLGIRVEVEQLTELDLVKCMVSGREFLAYALETDWEKLPDTSKRYRFVQANKGAYYAIKDAFKRVMPAQYAMLKELVEIVSSRNIMRF
jgi:predicted NUDIX family NTP pyrophosphohydrolase